MNYRVAREAGYFFKSNENKITASQFVYRLDSLRDEYRNDVNYVLMNLMDSHDTDRLPSQIVNADSKYDKNVNLNDNKNYDIRKPTADEIKTQKLMVLFQMTYVGAPMIYYGDEAGMWGADDPDERKPMLWADMNYENEESHPFGKARPRDANVFNADLFQHYTNCIRVRKSSIALRLGDFSKMLTDDAKDLVAYKRTYKKDVAIVILNNSELKQSIEIPLTGPMSNLKWKNIYNRATFSVKENRLTLELDAKSGMVLQATTK
jgi:glycosidase